MRLLQIPLWWAVALGLAINLSILHQDIAGLTAFALVFGLIFGGGMMAIRKTEPPSRRTKKNKKKRRHPRERSAPYRL